MPKQKNWYKRKQYKHFDVPLSAERAYSFVSRPDKVRMHSFSPLIHYEKLSRRVRKRKDIEKSDALDNRLVIKIKRRKIFYASHRDGYIYSYYNKILGECYEETIQKKSLSKSVIAYRSVKKGYCNIHFSRDVFSFIKSHKLCAIACVDISIFFDNLDVIILKKNWEKILNTNRLPNDHYSVYKNLRDFTYVNERDILKYFNIHPRNETNNRNPKSRICTYKELRDRHQKMKTTGSRLIKNKLDLNIKGIPQGTAISGMLSNIFMIDFDETMENYAKTLKGMYRRYSDDIIICIPDQDNPEALEAFIKKTLKNKTNDSLTLNNNKTEKRIFRKNGDSSSIEDENGKIKNIQYLGVEFDGKSIILRNSTVSKTIGKIKQYIRKKAISASKYKFKVMINGRYKIDCHDIMSKKTFTGLNLKKHAKIKVNGGSFITYALRFSSIAKESEINSIRIQKQITKIDRYVIKNMTVKQ